MTKKTSTPTKPPVSRFGPQVKEHHGQTASARSPWMSARTAGGERATGALRSITVSSAVMRHRDCRNRQEYNSLVGP